MGKPFLAIKRGARLRLGAAIQFPDRLCAQPVDPFFLEPGGAGGCEMPGCFQRRHIVFRAHIFRQPPDAAHHRRHQINPRRAMALDFAQCRFRVKARHDDDARAHLQRRKRGDERAVVIKRPRHQHDILARDPPERGHGGAGKPWLTGHNQLGPAGRSAGGRRFPRWRHAILKIAVVIGRRIKLRHRNNRLARIHRAIADHDRRVRKLGNGLQLARRQAKGNRLRHGPQFPRRITGFHKAHTVRQGDGEEVAELHTPCGQPARDPVGAQMQRPPCPRVALALHCNSIRLQRRFARECCADRNLLGLFHVHPCQ